MDQSQKDPVQKLRIALDMFGLGESIMRQKLRRAFPGASEEEIEARLWLWLSHHPGAETGDAPGRRRG
jgi:Rv0078B-related antitoxin